MLSKITTPKTKSELIKSIQTLKNPKIDVLEVWDKADKPKFNQQFDKTITKGNFSVIFLKDTK